MPHRVFSRDHYVQVQLVIVAFDIVFVRLRNIDLHLPDRLLAATREWRGVRLLTSHGGLTPYSHVVLLNYLAAEFVNLEHCLASLIVLKISLVVIVGRLLLSSLIISLLHSIYDTQ